MAKTGKNRKGESISGYFRPIFEAHPELIDQKSNKELVERWLADHHGYTDMPQQVKQNLANLKSHLRKKRREAEESGLLPVGALLVDGIDEEVGPHPLEPLEEQIDDCLTAAKTLDRDGLESVIKLLRRARNEVVWKIGQD